MDELRYYNKIKLSLIMASVCYWSCQHNSTASSRTEF